MIGKDGRRQDCAVDARVYQNDWQYLDEYTFVDIRKYHEAADRVVADLPNVVYGHDFVPSRVAGEPALIGGLPVDFKFETITS